MRFFFDRLFLAFSTLRLFLLDFFLRFALFFGRFGGRFAFFAFAVLVFVVFGFEVPHEPAQRAEARTSRGRAAFFGGRLFAARNVAGAVAASGCGECRNEREDRERRRAEMTRRHTNMSARSRPCLTRWSARSRVLEPLVGVPARVLEP